MGRAWQTFRRIWPYMLPYRRYAVSSLLFVFLGAGLSLLLPWPLALTIDSVIGQEPLPGILAPLNSEGRYTLLVLLSLSGLVLTAAQGIVDVLNEYVTTKLDQRMVLEFRSDLFRHSHRLSLAYHDNRRAGGFAYQINMQAKGAGALVVAIPPILQALATLTGMLIIACTIDLPLALVSLSVVPFIYYSVGYYAKRVEPRLIQVRQMEGESLAIVQEAMSMLRVVIPFGRESYEYGRFRNQGETAVEERVKLTVRQTVFSSVVNLITAIGTAAVLGFGAYRILQGQLSGGDLLIIISYIAQVYAPLEQLSTTFTQLQEQFVNVRGALDILDAKPEVEDAPSAYTIDRAEGSVAFDGVSFSYVGRTDTLKDISFQARAGERIAIVGPTGAGKTTLTALLLRFYDPYKGRILLDHTDIRDLTLKSLREQISIVMQEPLLFSGSIADNIRYGRLDASIEDVVEAAKAANAHDFIMRLPEGYETVLGERGNQLSGGERQRISVARAFLKDAPILILDEPTSAIDSKTEAVILDSLERLMVGRTTFMIAHRLSTIRGADLILVMNHGRLVEQGTHDELLRHNGLYRQLHDFQAGQAQKKELLAQAEGLELADQEASMFAQQLGNEVPPNDNREGQPTNRRAETQAHLRSDEPPRWEHAQEPHEVQRREVASSEVDPHQPLLKNHPHPRENTGSNGEIERSAEEVASDTFAERYEGEQTLTQRRTLLQIIRRRPWSIVIQKFLWVIVLITLVSTGTTLGFSLIVTGAYGIILLVTALALTVGAVLGVGLAFLLEHLESGRRSPQDLREQPDPIAQQGNDEATPFIAATPNPVPVGAGRGTTKITWNAGADNSPSQVYLSVNDGPEQLFAGAAQGSQEAPWIAEGVAYEFRLYAGTEHKALLATVTVTAEKDPGSASKVSTS